MRRSAVSSRSLAFQCRCWTTARRSIAVPPRWEFTVWWEGGTLSKKWYGYGSIPISTIFRGMNIHKSQLFWCEQKGYKGFDPSPYDTGEIWMGCFLMVADSVWRWLMLIMWMCVHSVSSHIWEPFDWRSFQKPRFGNHGWSTSIGFLVSIRLDFPSIFQSFRFSDTHHLYPLVN